VEREKIPGNPTPRYFYPSSSSSTRTASMNSGTLEPVDEQAYQEDEDDTSSDVPPELASDDTSSDTDNARVSANLHQGSSPRARKNRVRNMQRGLEQFCHESTPS
jgi:hypothetical protein